MYMVSNLFLLFEFVNLFLHLRNLLVEFRQFAIDGIRFHV